MVIIQRIKVFTSIEFPPTPNPPRINDLDPGPGNGSSSHSFINSLTHIVKLLDPNTLSFFEKTKDLCVLILETITVDPLAASEK